MIVWIICGIVWLVVIICWIDDYKTQKAKEEKAKIDAEKDMDRLMKICDSLDNIERIKKDWEENGLKIVDSKNKKKEKNSRFYMQK